MNFARRKPKHKYRFQSFFLIIEGSLFISKQRTWAAGYEKLPFKPQKKAMILNTARLFLCPVSCPFIGCGMRTPDVSLGPGYKVIFLVHQSNGQRILTIHLPLKKWPLYFFGLVSRANLPATCIFYQHLAGGCSSFGALLAPPQALCDTRQKPEPETE